MFGSFNYEETQQLEKATVRLREGTGAGKRTRKASMKEGTLSTGTGNVLPIVLTSLPHKPEDILLDG